jgi:ribosomal protein L11 methylase PrmA
MSAEGQSASSFRDPSGFIFKHSGILLRQVNASYENSFALLNSSGLYKVLSESGELIPHKVVGLELAQTPDAVAVLQPELIHTISYPYEWSFSQLKEAALLTLQIQRKAVEHGMSLKDASAYNIQFHNGRATFIDTLSFEAFDPSKPWVAYRQFCQHFVAPLVLMSHVDIRLSKLMETFIDGIPLDLASNISKPHTRFNAKIAVHLHLHAKMQASKGNSVPRQESRTGFGKNAILGLVDSLKSLVDGLNWKPEGTEWADYYSDTNYSSDSMAAKKKLVTDFIESANPLNKSLWDLGANNGEFSVLATALGFNTVAWDIDPSAVEKNYRGRREDRLLLPLIQDLTNPSPSIGWALKERESLVERGPVGVVMALALIHHLAIGNNVPLPLVASFFARLSNWLIIEFVPKEDSQVQRLLATREDVFPDYTQADFELSFSNNFEMVRKESINGTVRTLYLMRTRQGA